MENGPAKKARIGQCLYDAGEETGDPFEISSLRREVIDELWNLIGVTSDQFNQSIQYIPHDEITHFDNMHPGLPSAHGKKRIRRFYPS